MARIVGGPNVTVQVTSRETGAPLGGVIVTVSDTVYTDPEMTVEVTTITADGGGRCSFYAAPGNYTFTTNSTAANTIEPVEVLGQEEGTGQRALSVAEARGTYAPLTASLRSWALSASFSFSNTPTLDTVTGAITAGNITWPDGGTGTYSATIDTNGAVTQFVATYVPGVMTAGATVTVTIPRNSSGQINGAMTVSIT